MPSARIAEIVVGGTTEPWERLGLSFDKSAATIGGVRLRVVSFLNPGIQSVGIHSIGDEHADHDAQTWPRIPGYEITRVIDQGGMGVVYEARQLELGRTVAIKMIFGIRLIPVVFIRWSRPEFVGSPGTMIAG